MSQRPESQQLPTDKSDRIIELFRSIQKNFKEYFFEKTRQYGFTVPQTMVIFQLYHNPFITLQELSDKLGLSKSTVSGIIDRLEQHGVVVREIPKENRRIVKLSLSPEFSGINNLLDLKKKYFVDIMKNANQEDIEKIICGMEKLAALMKRD